MTARIDRRAKTLTRVGNAALVLGLTVSTVSASLLLLPSPVSAATSGDSSVTVSWAATHPETTPASLDYDVFKDLSVTVSQTTDLTNQGIRISWSGAAPTSPGEFATNYLQVMQCWGDDPSGPTQKQCQWGAGNPFIVGLLGASANGRSLPEYGDPNQTLSADLKIPPPRSNPFLRAWAYPFVSVKGVSTFQVADFFTPQTSNEVAAVRTGEDGSGSIIFETQTSLEAPHLGCGSEVTGSSQPRSCWLVIVPRGETNADGTPASSAASRRLAGTPLSASNWANRIVVKLDFQPVAVSCPLGNPERRVVGSEMLGEAFTSWQPALCTGPTTYGFSQIGDSEARTQILSDISGGSKLAFFAAPLSAEAEAAADTTIVYAPVAQSAIVVAYSIDYDLVSTASNFSSNGTEVTSLTLNPRLIAKLLTQSYRVDVPGGGRADPIVTANPRSVLSDQEFLQLNPTFAGFSTTAAPDGLMVALGSSDANAQVWSWLRADPLAKSFLAGEPDEWGMTINPQYKALALATTTTTDSFPKADLTTYQASADVPAPGFGTLDMRPYMNDMHDAAYRTLRADANVKTNWDTTKSPPGFVSIGAQMPGRRFALSITDSAAAAKFGLRTAKLVNGAGQAVAPTEATIRKAIGAMKESDTAGVKVNDPAARTTGAYPLAMLTYAGVNVCAASSQEIADYSRVLTYAAGAGQVSGDAKGQLPRGYVPLDATFTKQTLAGVTALSTAKSSCTSDAETAGEEPPVSESTTTEVAPVEQVTPTADPEDQLATSTTADEPLPASRLGLAAALALGIPTMIAGPFLTRRGRRLASLADLDQ